MPAGCTRSSPADLTFGSLPMDLTPNLHAFLWTSPRANNCNTYLIRSAEKTILIDPGHSPGGVCLYWPAEKALFSWIYFYDGRGDVVFDSRAADKIIQSRENLLENSFGTR